MHVNLLKKELKYSTTRSSGSGGQHVNKTETRVELRFDVVNSDLLDDAQKALILKRLHTRISQDGILIMSNQESRSQLANKKAVTSSFLEILEKALIPPKSRKKVVPLVSAPVVRLSLKKQNTEKKSMRKKVNIHQENDLCGG